MEYDLNCALGDIIKETGRKKENVQVDPEMSINKEVRIYSSGSKTN